MQLEKKYLVTLYQLVQGTEGVLTLAEGRIRDAFNKPLYDHTHQYETDRVKIYENYCDKKDGKPDISDGKYHFNKKNTPLVEKELQTLNSEEIELPDTKGIKEIIERTQYKPKIGESEIIDTIIAKF